jgi:hypothetical protein
MLAQAQFTPRSWPDGWIFIQTYLVMKPSFRKHLRFGDLSGIGDLATSSLDTNKHVSFLLVYQLLKRVVICWLPQVCVEMLLSNEYCQKSMLRDETVNSK